MMVSNKPKGVPKLQSPSIKMASPDRGFSDHPMEVGGITGAENNSVLEGITCD